MPEQPAVAYYHGCNYNSLTQLQRLDKMHGAKRVIVFCCLTAILPTIILIIPLYLRHKIFMDTHIPVAESDILEVKEGISSIFCEAHTLRMNSTFSAFQIQGNPTYSKKRKHVRLMKSMTLPDDTLEYWGFYLPQGSTVNLSVCSRYSGASILVVKGEKQLRTCGFLDHHKKQSQMNNPNNEVKVTFETAAEVIHNHPMDEENHGGEIDNDIDDDDDVEILKNTASKIIDQKSKKKNKRDLKYKDRNVVAHGNFTEQDSDTSSFEASLLLCYEGLILLSHQFNESDHCTDVHFLAQVTHMSVEHKVSQDGYYYYIFYSDNDLVSNDLHAVFNIYKPTLLYSNMSNPTDACINQTECGFQLDLLDQGAKKVIVEVPTRDGIEHEPDDVTILISTCKPRIGIYLIFPFLVLACIMCCAFI
ncbi:hypothetical protein M8J76_009970 [Diaphorina citri]|nr:hypothetical protein M8J76_009970 [Diaphorina citri]KAI5741969.1 hypothetical protein M8J77_001617 [Diaphorina citri]